MQICDFSKNTYNPYENTNTYEFNKNIKETEKNKKENSTTQEISKDGNHLTEAEKRIITELRITDLKVRTHEAAHMAAGSGLAGSATYTYEEGPNGRMYAVAGEVPISMPASSSPEENLRNARKMRAAALAPSDPSPQDLKVAATATMMEMKAQIQIRKQKENEAKEAIEKTKNKDKSLYKISEGNYEQNSFENFSKIA